ncbi:MAG: hypothetical protein LUC22_03020 [Prevotella sp.]|nr:hypothetical protein [Prevotella sp.]
MKTSIDITDDIYEALVQTSLTAEVSGELCKGARRHGSKNEDIVISCAANSPAQSQSAVVYVNIYTAGITIDGQTERDFPRMRELSKMAMRVLSHIRDRAFRVVFDTQGDEYVEATNEYVITNRLLYQIINE